MLIKTGAAKIYLEDNQFDNILRLFEVSKIFASPQVKRWEIVRFKNGIYDLPH